MRSSLLSVKNRPESQGHNRLASTHTCPQSWEGTNKYGILEDWFFTSTYMIGLTPALPDLALVQEDNIIIEADSKETGQTGPSLTWGLLILLFFT